MSNVLVLIDIQKEYVTRGRPFYLEGIDASLENCRKLLQFARENNWEIMHVQHTNGIEAPKFNPQTEHYNFVDEFEPAVGEKHFIKNDYSCYSNSAFANRMRQLNKSGNNKIYLIGYNTVMCILSTLESARLKKHPMILVADAVYAKSIGEYNEHETHQFMVDLINTKKLATIECTKAIFRKL